MQNFCANSILKIILTTFLYLCFTTPAIADFKSWLLEASPATPVVKTNKTNIDLDQSAKTCLSCHNGTYATHITVKGANSPMQMRGFMTVNHPIGMFYDEYVQHKPKAYWPRGILAPEIQFVDGRVTCVSCHQLKDRRANSHTQSSGGFRTVSLNSNNAESCLSSKHLTAGPRQTDLCLTCHIK